MPDKLRIKCLKILQDLPWDFDLPDLLQRLRHAEHARRYVKRPADPNALRHFYDSFDRFEFFY